MSEFSAFSAVDTVKLVISQYEYTHMSRAQSRQSLHPRAHTEFDIMMLIYKYVILSTYPPPLTSFMFTPAAPIAFSSNSYTDSMRPRDFDCP